MRINTLMILVLVICCLLATVALADPPPNDNCVNATDAGTLIDGVEVNLAGTVTDAGQECVFNDGAEVWVKFTVAGCMDVTIDFCSDENFVGENLAGYLFDECPCGENIYADDNDFCDNYNPSITWHNLTAGTYYYPIAAIAITADDYSVSITGEDCPPAPDNDDCANALNVGDVTELTYSTRAASFDGEGTCISSPNIWYIYSSTVTADVRIELDAGYSAQLAVYDGVNCSPLPTELDCSFEDYLDFAAVAGNQYLIEIGGTGSNTGDGLLTIGEVPEPPANDSCVNADDAGILVSDESVQLTGTTEEATQDCGSLEYSEVWIKFSISDYMTVTIDYCDNPPGIDMYGASSKLFTDCPCEDDVYSSEMSYCTNGNPIYIWNYLPAGTYFYPILSSYQLDGPYAINILGIDSSAPPTGACCNNDSLTCVVVDEYTCSSVINGTWMGEGTECGTYDEETGWSGCEEPPTGACCLFEGMECMEYITEDECVNVIEGTWMGEDSECGFFDGNSWSGCSSEPVTGACCVDDGRTCYSDVTEDSCQNYLSGTWKGAYSECGEYDDETGWSGCLEPELGACCLQGGLECMEQLDEITCVEQVQGEWQGPDSECGIFNDNEGWSGCQSSNIYEYLPGDANMSTGNWPPSTIGGDVTYLVNYFRGITAPCMLDGFYASADANGSCSVTGADVTKLVSYFRGMDDLNYCPDYPTTWPPLPDTAPDGWPNCTSPILSK